MFLHRYSPSFLLKKTWRSFQVLCTIIITLALLGLIRAAFFPDHTAISTGTNGGDPVPSSFPTSSPDHSLDKFYKSEAFQVVFTYPNTTSVEVKNSIYANRGNNFGQGEAFQTLFFKQGEEEISIYFYDPTLAPKELSNISLYTPVLKKSRGLQGEHLTDVRTFLIDSLPTTYEVTDIPTNEEVKPNVTFHFLTPDKKYYIVIHANKKYENSQVLKQIIDSWHFTQPNYISDISKWKKFSVDNITFSVPLDWRIFTEKSPDMHYYLTNVIPKGERYDNEFIDSDMYSFDYYEVKIIPQNNGSIEDAIKTSLQKEEKIKERKIVQLPHRTVIEYKMCGLFPDSFKSEFACRNVLAISERGQVFSINADYYQKPTPTLFRVLDTVEFSK